jgi:hypothetical protein
MTQKKIYAFYLPQFHETQENNIWWGKGFTEWDNVKAARPFLKDQAIPRIPLNNHYYDLSLISDLKQQAHLQSKFGLAGFSVYHYWSEGVQLLSKPIELIMQNQDIDFKFHLTWANHPWVRSWRNSASNGEVLLHQTYEVSKEDRLKHFKYLANIMSDQRYNHHENKLLFNIYKPASIPNLENYILELRDYIFSALGKELIINGMLTHNESEDRWVSSVDNLILFQPGTALFNSTSLLGAQLDTKGLKHFITSKLISSDFLGKKFLYNLRNKFFQKPKIYQYEDIYELLLQQSKVTSYRGKNIILGCFVDWDNTPRYGQHATVIRGATPEKFKAYLTKLRGILDAKGDNLLFINAWNEWGESAYLEPDDHTGYKNLEAIKNVFNL